MLQPESRGQRSYYEAFARRRNLTPNVLAKERVLTDRGAYLNFLEVQLERVSAACLATQALSQDLKGVTAQASSAEDKVLSATRLVRLAQTYSEEMGREQARINDALEQRLAHVERHIHTPGITVSAESIAAIDSGGSSRDREGDPVFSPMKPLVESPGLSRWMQNVNKRIVDLQQLFADSKGPTAAASAAVMESAGNADVLIHPDENEIENENEEEEVEEALRSTVPPETIPPADLAGMKERLRRLEERSGDVNAEESTRRPRASDDEDTNDSDGDHVEGTFESFGRSERPTDDTPTVDTGLGTINSRGHDAPGSICRSSRSPSVEAVLRRTTNEVLEAVDAGRAEARRAREAAEEALRVGKEAAERSERTESLAKTLAVRSTKVAREQHERINDALCRLAEKSRKLATEGEHSQASLTGLDRNEFKSTRQTEQNRHSPSAPLTADMAHASGDGITNGPQLRRHTRHGRNASRAGVEVVNEGSRPRGDTQCEVDDDNAHHSLRDIRSILEALSVESGAGRRIALGAARTALQSILKESLSHEARDRNHGDYARNEPGNGRRRERRTDRRKSDELRGAITGAIDVLSGLSSSRLPAETLHQPSRCPRRGSRPRMRLSRSRDRSTPAVRRDGERLGSEGYWVPPGNIPSRIGERNKLGRVRAAWNMPGDEGEEEA